MLQQRYRAAYCLLETWKIKHISRYELSKVKYCFFNIIFTIHFSVFSIKYKDASRSNTCDPGITFQEAKAVCLSRQTFLASPNDLLYSKSLGFAYKRCCWLSDNTVGYVDHDANTVQYCSVSKCPWTMCVLK